MQVALGVDGDAGEGEDDAAANRSAEDAGWLEDAAQELIDDLVPHRGFDRSGDDVVVVDPALLVHVGLNDDHCVVVGHDRVRVDCGVQVMRNGDGAEGFVIGQDGLRRGGFFSSLFPAIILGRGASPVNATARVATHFRRFPCSATSDSSARWSS